MDIAICIIAYNRLDSLKRCLKSLEEADYQQIVKLYISVDKSDTDIIENFAKDYKWQYGEKEVILHKENLGLRKHVLSCGDLLEQHDAVVILEDDIVVSPAFFNYTIQTVEKYFDNDDIAGISIYSFSCSYHQWQPFTPLKSSSDVYLLQNASSWGEIWMKNQWHAFKEWYNIHCAEFEEKPHLPKSICSWPKSSWLKYHTRYCIENDKYFIYPYNSYSTCFSDVGVHTIESSPIPQVPLSQESVRKLNLNPIVKYDSFFENEAIYKWIGIPKSDLCIDYYGDKDNRELKRYWLTRKICGYKVVRSFDLVMKPYELNIKYDIKGDKLFLYDTSQGQCEAQENYEILKKQFFYMYNTPLVTDKLVLKGYFGKWIGLIMVELKIIRIIRRIISVFKHKAIKHH